MCKYIQSSWEANMIMSGLESYVDKRYSTWTKKQIASLRHYINKHSVRTPKPIVLYRGAQATPILEAIADDIAIQRFVRKEPLTNLSPMSTSTSRVIAKEFIRRGGYIHVLHVEQGVQLIDLNDVSCDKADLRIIKAKTREKEVIIAPYHQLTPLKKYGNVLHWRITTMHA